MVQIEFDFNQVPTVIQANLEDLFKDIINKYIQKTSLNPTSICFLGNGKNHDPEKTIESQMSETNKQNKQ